MYARALACRARAQYASNPSCSRTQCMVKRHAAMRNAQALCCSCLVEFALSAARHSVHALHLSQSSPARLSSLCSCRHSKP
eukprot:1037720-Alexandrium_andersonii.AAC.2